MACDGQEGLEIYLENHNKDLNHQIDIVITDLNMPRMDGFTMLRTIRTLNPSIKAIITSAFSDSEFLKQASELDMLNDYLTKPFNLKEIYNRLKINETKVLEKKEFERLQKLHQQYEYAANKKMLVSKTDLNGDIVFVNDKFCKLSGYTKEELLGQKHSIVRSGKTPPKIFQRMWQTSKL